jgi:hypothetical protein
MVFFIDYLKYLKEGYDEFLEMERERTENGETGYDEGLEGLFLRRITLTALEKANAENKGTEEEKLTTLWERIHLKKPLGAFSIYAREDQEEENDRYHSISYSEIMFI